MIQYKNTGLDFGLYNQEFLQKKKLSLSCEGVVWFSAVAGGGKTTLIIKKILKFFLSGVKPEKIVVITYTNESVNEIKNRLFVILQKWYLLENSDELRLEIVELLDSDVIIDNVLDSAKKFFLLKFYEKINVSTFHSFCLSNLSNFDQKIKYQSISILNNKQIQLIINKIINELQFLIIKKNFSVEKISKLCFLIINNNNNLLKKNINFFLNKINIFSSGANLSDRYIVQDSSNFNSFDVYEGIIDNISSDKIDKKLKNNNIDGDDLSVKNPIIANSLDNKNFTEIIYMIFLKYFNYKKENHKYDFNDIIENFYFKIKYCEQKQAFLFNLSQKYQHFIFDEAQDNSFLQWEIIKILTEELFYTKQDSMSLSVFGDIKQSIYSFQNSSPSMFLKTKRYFAEKCRLYDVKFYDINWNFCFRSNVEILQFVDRYFNNDFFLKCLISKNISHIAFSNLNNNQQKKSIDLYNLDKKIISQHIDYNDKFCISSLIFNEITSLLNQGISCSQIMIIFRSRNKIINNLYDILAKNNINFSSKDVILNISNFDLHLVLDFLLLFFNQVHQDFSKLILKFFNGECKGVLNKLVQSFAEFDFEIFVNYVFLYIEKKILNLNKYALLYIQTAIKDMKSIDNQMPLYSLLKSLQNNFCEISLDWLRNSYSNNNDLKILTIHSSKGLEADYVLFYDDFSNFTFKKNANHISITEDCNFFCINDSDYGDKSPEKIINSLYFKTNSEEVRLLYVALTRARKNIKIFCANGEIFDKYNQILNSD